MLFHWGFETLLEKPTNQGHPLQEGNHWEIGKEDRHWGLQKSNLKQMGHSRHDRLTLHGYC